MLGLSLDDVPRIRGFYDAFAGGMVYDGDPEPQRSADAARAEFSQLLLGELERARRAPDASVTSAVVSDSATELSDDEVVAQLRVILFGAIETIESMVLNTIMLLLDHPEQFESIRADAELIPNAVEESLRLIPPVTFIERWASAATAVGDVELGVGEFVGVSTLGANRDPDVFADPLHVRHRSRELPATGSPSASACITVWGSRWRACRARSRWRRSAAGCPGSKSSRSSGPPGSCSASPRCRELTREPRAATRRRRASRSACSTGTTMQVKIGVSRSV